MDVFQGLRLFPARIKGVGGGIVRGAAGSHCTLAIILAAVRSARIDQGGPNVPSRTTEASLLCPVFEDIRYELMLASSVRLNVSGRCTCRSRNSASRTNNRMVSARRRHCRPDRLPCFICTPGRR